MIPILDGRKRRSPFSNLDSPSKAVVDEIEAGLRLHLPSRRNEQTSANNSNPT
jgi:hypothetical protein